MGIDYDSIGGLGIQVEVKVRYEDETTWMSIDGKDVYRKSVEKGMSGGYMASVCGGHCD